MISEKDGFTFLSFNGNGLDNGNMSAIQDRLEQLVAPDTIYVDCGAHIGTMSIPVIAKTKPREAILIEANPEVIPLLEGNCRINIPEQNVRVLHRAICDREAEIDFFILREKADSSSMVREDITKSPPIKVLGVTLNTLLKDYENIVMKVDIECAELLMWKGMSKVRPKHIILEWFQNGAPAGWCNELLELIYKSGYEILSLSGETLKDEEIMAFGKEDLWLRSERK